MDVIVSQASKKLVYDTFRVALSAVCIGILSVLMPVVGSKVLGADELSVLLGSWALINTIQFGLLTPIENFAPRYRSSAMSRGHSEHQIENFLTRYAVSASLVAGFVLIVYFLAINEKSSGQLIIGTLFFIFSNGMLASQRSLLAAQGKFDSILKKNITITVVGIVGFALVILTKWSYAGAVFLVFGSANASGYLMGRLGKSTKFTNKDYKFNKTNIESCEKQFQRSQIPRLGILSLTTISALLLTNGTIIVAKIWNVDSNFIVSYSAALNLALVFYVLLNSVTPPLYNRALVLIESGSHQGVGKLFFKTFVGYLSATLVISFSFYMVGPWALGIYVGDAYSITRTEFFLIAFGEGLVTLTGIPKIFLIAVHRDRVLLPIWILGIGVFLVLFVGIDDKQSSMLFVPIAAASTILVLATVVFFKSVASSRRKWIVTAS
jgi:hypothetical protein